MKIKMLADWTYSVDPATRRTLPAGLVLNEDDAVAQAAIESGVAEPFGAIVSIAAGTAKAADEAMPVAAVPARTKPKGKPGRKSKADKEAEAAAAEAAAAAAAETASAEAAVADTDLDAPVD